MSARFIILVALLCLYSNSNALAGCTTVLLAGEDVPTCERDAPYAGYTFEGETSLAAKRRPKPSTTQYVNASAPSGELCLAFPSRLTSKIVNMIATYEDKQGCRRPFVKRLH